jgi:hypothetical protein
MPPKHNELTFETAFTNTIVDALESYQSMAEQVLSKDATRQGFERLVLELVYRGFEQLRAGPVQP